MSMRRIVAVTVLAIVGPATNAAFVSFLAPWGSAAASLWSQWAGVCLRLTFATSLRDLDTRAVVVPKSVVTF